MPLFVPALVSPAELSPGVRIGVKLLASRYTFPDTGNRGHLVGRRGEVAESLASLELSRDFGMIANGAHISRKGFPWERAYPQEILIGKAQIDGIASGRDGDLLVQIKSSGGGTAQIKGAAGHILVDHLKSKGRGRLAGLVYVDVGDESYLRYHAVKSLYEVFGGSPHGATTLDQRMLGGQLPGNAASGNEVRTALFQYGGHSPGLMKERLETHLREIQSMGDKRMSGDQMLKLIEPLGELFGFRELAVMNLGVVGDTLGAEARLSAALGPNLETAHEIVAESDAAATAGSGHEGSAAVGGGTSTSGESSKTS